MGGDHPYLGRRMRALAIQEAIGTSPGHGFLSRSAIELGEHGRNVMLDGSW